MGTSTIAKLITAFAALCIASVVAVPVVPEVHTQFELFRLQMFDRLIWSPVIACMDIRVSSSPRIAIDLQPQSFAWKFRPN